MGSITFRPIQPDDIAFLQQVYASTRLDELAVTGWSAAEVDAFLRMQFTAQHQHYTTVYSGASFQLIVDDGDPIGRLYVARWASEIRIVDIALLPAFRGRGIGTAIMTGLQAEARSAGKPLSIHVEQANPALRLYQRLGFRIIADRGVYWLLEWRASSGVAAP
jgi:ribosomal protein S18 acetylase RimI-like enzyme